MQPKPSSLHQRCRTWLTRTTALVALSGFSVGGVLPVGAQIAHDVLSPRAVSHDGNLALGAEITGTDKKAIADILSPLWLSIQGMGSVYGPYPKFDGSFDTANEPLVESDGLGRTVPQSFYYQSGSAISLQVKPQEGWYFDGWEGACSGTQDVCTVTMNEDKQVTAKFTDISHDSHYNLTVEKTEGGKVVSLTRDSRREPDGKIDCDSLCSATYAKNTRVHLEVIPDNGFRFGGWRGCDEIGYMNSCNLTMNQTKIAEAKFIPENSPTVSLDITMEGKGARVELLPRDEKSSSNAASSHASCGYNENECRQKFSYLKGTIVTIKPDSSFIEWKGAECSGSQPLCTITMDSDKSIAAKFTYTDISELEMNEVTVRHKGSGSGSITYKYVTTIQPCLSSVFCSILYISKGFDVELVAHAKAGSIFTGWMEGPCTGSTARACKFFMNQNAMHLVAQFDRNPLASPTTCQARHFTPMEEKVQNAYIAFYGRSADVQGLAWWSNALEKAGGDISTIMDAFGNSDEYRDRFAHMSERELVNNLYRQLFARNGDSAGLDWYVAQMQQGKATLASIALDIAGGAQAGSNDWDVLEGRRKVARHYITLMENQSGGDTEATTLPQYLEQYIATAHEGSADAVCEALNQAVLP